MHTENGITMYSVARVDGLPGFCGSCFRDVPVVVESRTVEFAARDDGKFTRYRVAAVFTCRACAPARAAVLFDSPHLELFNGQLQAAH